MKLRILPALFAVLIGITSCSKSKAEPSALVDQAWAPYLESATDGEISRKGPIRLRFVEAMVDSSEVGKEFDGKLNFEPSISGTATWETPRDLVFKPGNALEPGATFLGRLAAKGLRGVPDNIEDFLFKFSIVRQKYTLEWNGFTAQEGADTALYSLEGILTTTDFADSLSLTKFLSATQSKNDLQVAWKPDPAGQVHVFHIQNVRRAKTRSSLHIKLDPKAIGMEEGIQEHDLAIPAAGEFDLLFAKPIDGANQGIQLQFTDPLSPQTDLASLIRINGISPLKFELKGSRLDVFLPKIVAGTITIELDSRLPSKRGTELGRNIKKDITFKVQEPGVRFVGQGVILPESEKLIIPIEATTLREVTVEAFQIYASNMGQFLQVNNLEGNQESRRVGRFLWRKHVRLADSGRGPRQWTRYGVDVTDLLKENRGSLFRIHLKMERNQSIYPCGDAPDTTEVLDQTADLDNWDDNLTRESSGWDGWSGESEGGSEGEDGESRERKTPNACTDGYFRKVPSGETRQRNLLTSNIGLVAKSGMDGNWHIAASDLRTAEPLSGVDVVINNFQGQPIGKASTSSDGLVQFKTQPGDVPFFLKATKGKDIGYLKVSSGAALPTSHFEVGGDRSESGVKGAFFGERGVWRPGDSIFLTLLVENKDNIVPAGHPIRFELRDPSGKLAKKETRAFDASGFQVFRLATDPESPTGNWTATAWVGDRHFSKTLSIEMIKPNRLDVQLKWNSDTLRSASLEGSLFGQWLHGASAGGLSAEVTAALIPLPLRFDRYSEHIFEDPSRTFSSDRQEVWTGTLDAQGKASISTQLNLPKPPSSALQARFTSSITEPGGDESNMRMDAVWLPFERYVGVLIPKGDHARDMLRTDTTHKIQIVVLDNHGKPSGANSLHATLSKLGWNWWYESNQNNQGQFQQARSQTPILDTTLTAPKGVATWPMRIRYPEWGYYFLRVCDASGEEDEGHCAGKVVFIDWPGWAGRPKEQQSAGANMLSVSTDKPSYLAGETAILSIPSATKGRVLVSLESGVRVLKTFWTEAKPGGNRVEIPLDASMAPGIYAHVSLIQPHEGRKNDLPLRLYGVVPLKVEDPSARLAPEIVVPAEMAPNQDLKVQVKEKQGRPMTYTIAVVDEGLLGLTGFKTPDPLAEFRRKEALGVRTWDLYDWVVGAYSGQLDRLLSIGGDGPGEAKAANGGKPNRFPPIVRFIGPFHLDKNGQATHAIPIPEYVGKVRVMVLAGETAKWGSTQAQVFIRKPLMILPTVPRVVRPGEEVVVPVNVFVMKDGLGPIQVNMDAGGWTGLDGLQRTVNLRKSGETLVRFRLKVPERLGAATLKFKANSGGESAEQTINLPILSANLPQTESGVATVEPGRTWTTSLQPKGMDGTREGWLELSSAPRMGIENRMQSLIGYPYGCLEQTTSKGFPQLLLVDAMQLSSAQKAEIQKNVRAALQRIHGFLQPGGILTYWPGGEEQGWTSLWAGHFLLEAQARGYEIPGEMLSVWKLRQKTLASRWWSPGNASETQEQAYRLFLLALGQSADLSAMNRLRTIPDRLPASARWMLGSAYAISGQADAAASLTQGAMRNIDAYVDPGSTFGSALRDKALASYAMSRLGRKADARQAALAVADSLATGGWQSTQSLAWSLLAISSAFGSSPESWELQARIDGKATSIQSQKPMMTFPLDALRKSNSVKVELSNPGKTPLYVKWVTRGTPVANQEKEESRGLSIETAYAALDGSTLDPSQLTQGKDFHLTVSLTNQTGRHLRNLALTQLIPSGWELHSTRLDGAKALSGVSYQDLRDDRIMSFLDLAPHSTIKIPIFLHATYPGTFQLPATVAESMYEGDIRARTRGSSVIVKP